MHKILTSNIDKDEAFKFYFGLGVCIAATIGLFLSFVQPGDLKTDGSIFAAVALKDLQSGGLYLNAWENKPPGIFFTIELFLWLIPNAVYAVFTLALSGFILTAACLYVVILNNLKSYSSSILLTLIALYFTVYENNIADGLCTEIYGTLCILLSMVFMQIFKKNEKIAALMLSASFIGLSFWYKEPIVFISITLYFISLQFIQSNKNKIIYSISMAIPSILIVVLLYFKGSFWGYIDSIKYNLAYLNLEESISLKVKINDFYTRLIYPLLTLTLFFSYLGYKALVDRKTSREVLFQILFLLSTFVVFALSPHNFGHYYYPAFTLIFVVFSRLFALYFEAKHVKLKWPLIAICVFTFYRIDETQKPDWTFKIKPIQEDQFVRFLKDKKDKTLFVDYVVKGDYYIKTGMLFPTFLPVALPIHFGENKSGFLNRERIWKDLSSNPPDYLITTYTNSYFSWFLPESKFYENNYQKIDSILPANENVLYLWQHK